jgi:prepilin-type N-terminal cleavage/methylation domain-containing protein
MNKKGFTLIELIIVIAVIALLAAAVFVAVDPAQRIGEARDSQRWSDVTAVADGIMKYIADNNGTFPTSTATFTAGTNYLIVINGYEANDLSGFTCSNGTTVDGSNGVDLGTNLVSTYLATIPVDPGGSQDSGVNSHYYFSRASTGRVTIGSCIESDYASASIYVQR